MDDKFTTTVNKLVENTNELEMVLREIVKQSPQFRDSKILKHLNVEMHRLKTIVMSLKKDFANEETNNKLMKEMSEL